MEHTSHINTLRLIQASDDFKARLAGEFSSVHGLSVNEFFMLLHLERAEQSRLSRVDLARRMHVSASTVTRMVAPMEKIGLVARQANERDARYAFVALTKAGRTKLNDAQATFQKRAEALFEDRWSDAEQDTLGTLLQRLIAGSAARLA